MDMALSDWIGRTETRHDVIAPGPCAGLAATLDRPEGPPAEGTPIPPLWHWLYFLDRAPASELGPDGHPRRGGFLPPVALPRRMWAGGRLTFVAPLRIGDRVTRRSTIADVSEKTGRSGALVFVTVRHDYLREGEATLALSEQHDIVYRAAPRAHETPATPTPPAGEAEWRREWRPDPVLLFRYSALTFNGHRIHYDHPYATAVEGYPGLVVHGPLIATLLLELLRDARPEARLTAFRFRALRPTFAPAPFLVSGRTQPDGSVRLWAQDEAGWMTMEATAQVA